MDAGPRGGLLLTRPLIFAGSRLELNVKTGRDGLVRVDLLDGEARSVLASGEPFTGDSVAAVVRWKKAFDLGALAVRHPRGRAIHHAD